MIVKGIYQIKNNINNQVYIGSSKNIFVRWRNHVEQLNSQTHHSHKLQKDWLKYNIQDFSFSIMEIVSNDKLLKEREQFYIDQYEIENLYNIMAYTKYDNKLSVPESFVDINSYIDNLDEYTIHKLKENINIFSKVGKMNKIGNEYYDLSKTWFIKNNNSIEQLGLNMYNYFKNYCHVKTNEMAWTTFSQYFYQMKFKGLIKSFIPMNGKIETEINKRNSLCFVANCFPNSFIKNNSEVKINDDTYALSILIKWIVSVSDIEKEINIFLQSKRMEDILRDWIN